MRILKFLDIILIISICSYIGFYKSKRFGKRVKNLKDFKNALNIFKSKIEFTYEPICEVFEEISKTVYQNNNNIFKDFCVNILKEGVQDSWSDAVFESKLEFKNDDKEILNMLGKMLGKTDKDGQISEIELVSKFLDKQILEAEEQKSKNEKMYKSLGVICGLALAIILI